MEKTLSIVKPDAVSKNVIGKIIHVNQKKIYIIHVMNINIGTNVFLMKVIKINVIGKNQI